MVFFLATGISNTQSVFFRVWPDRGYANGLPWKAHQFEKVDKLGNVCQLLAKFRLNSQKCAGEIKRMCG